MLKILISLFLFVNLYANSEDLYESDFINLYEKNNKLVCEVEVYDLKNDSDKLIYTVDNEKYFIALNKEDIKTALNKGIVGNNICVSNVKDFSNLFSIRNQTDILNLKKWKELLIDLNNWDMSNAKNLDSLFKNNYIINPKINEWNVFKVTNFKKSFFNSKMDVDLSNWNVSSGKYFNSMFEKSNFNGIIQNWDMSSAEDISGMFSYAFYFNQSIEKWKFKKYVKASYLFYGAISFNQPMNDLDIKYIYQMDYFFSNALSFNQDLDKWKEFQVDVKFVGFFQNAISFNGNVSTWFIQRDKDLSYMFDGAIDFEGDLRKWNINQGQGFICFNEKKNFKIPKYHNFSYCDESKIGSEEIALNLNNLLSDKQIKAMFNKKIFNFYLTSREVYNKNDYLTNYNLYDIERQLKILEFNDNLTRKWKKREIENLETKIKKKEVENINNEGLYITLTILFTILVLGTISFKEHSNRGDKYV